MQWFRLAAVGLLLGMSVGAPTGCTTNPATGERFFTTLSPEQEAAIGAQAAPELAQEFGGPVQNAQLQQYVTNIGKRLAAETEGYFPTLEWEFTLLDSPVINAFALPGGKVFITRGLAERMTNEAQMAAVLGHEVGHVSAQHTARRIGQQTLFNAGVVVAGLAVGLSDEQSSVRKVGQYAVPALAVGGNLVLLKFGRDEEAQSDYLGMRYMTKIGYNPRAQLQVMEILREASGGGGGQIEWLSTHPMPDTRIQRIEQLLQTDEFKHTQNNPNYQFYEERYQNEFLRILKTLPPPKQPAAPSEAEVRQQLQRSGGASRSAAPAERQRISRPARSR